MWINFNKGELELISIALKEAKGAPFERIAVEIKRRVAEQELAEAEKYRRAASDRSKDGELEVDDEAVVSMGDDPGAYVMAWIWVTNGEAGVKEGEEVS